MSQSIKDNNAVDVSYIISFKANSTNQTLTVTWELTNIGGNVTLHGAALASGAGDRVSSLVERITDVEAIMIYPNPVSSILHMSIPDVGSGSKGEVVLYDPVSGLVYNKPVLTSSAGINHTILLTAHCSLRDFTC